VRHTVRRPRASDSDRRDGVSDVGDEAPGDASMPLVEHLYELRRRLQFSLLAVGIALILAFVFFTPIFDFLNRPYCQLPPVRRQGAQACTLFARGVVDPFKVRLHVALLVGLLGAAPVWLYQLWAFITPGLHRHERRWALTFVGASVVMFGIGAVLAYEILPTTLNALLGFAGNHVTTLLEATAYLSFVQGMVLVFGVGFEMPLLLVLLNAADVVRGRTLLGWWRGVVFGITIFAGAAAPSPDVFTMLALAVPLVALFFLAVGIAIVNDRRRDRKRAAEDAALDAELARAEQARRSAAPSPTSPPDAPPPPPPIADVD
jgi:sec-independent protein translocase protein TatC